MHWRCQSFRCTFLAAPTLQVQGPCEGWEVSPWSLLAQGHYSSDSACSTCRPSLWITVPISQDGLTPRCGLVSGMQRGQKTSSQPLQTGSEPRRGEQAPGLDREFKGPPKPSVVKIVFCAVSLCSDHCKQTHMQLQETICQFPPVVTFCKTLLQCHNCNVDIAAARLVTTFPRIPGVCGAPSSSAHTSHGKQCMCSAKGSSAHPVFTWR